MINEEILSEKLKYLIIMNGKNNQFEVLDVKTEFEYLDQLHEKLNRYDVDVKVDYLGSIDLELEDFLYDFRQMVNKLSDVVGQYVINKEGKIVSFKDSNCIISQVLFFNLNYVYDETHIFEIGYTFQQIQD